MKVALPSLKLLTIFCLIVGIFLVVYVWFEGTTTKDIPDLPMPVESGNVEALWFSSDGTLLSIETEKTHMFLRQYDSAGGAWGRRRSNLLDFQALEKKCGLNPRAAPMPRAFTISPDGRLIIFSLENAICSLEFAGEKAQIILLDRAVPLSSLAFLGSDRYVIAGYSDGHLRLIDLEAARVDPYWRKSLGREPHLIRSGNMVLEASFSLRTLLCFEEEKREKKEVKVIELNAHLRTTVGVVVAEDCQHLASGTDDGEVEFIKKDRGKRESPRRTMHLGSGSVRVRALSYAAGGDLYIGGDFESIYILAKGDKAPQPFLSVASGIRLLAVKPKCLAYVNSLGLAVVDIRSYREITGRGAFFFNTAGFALTLIGALLGLVSVLITLRDRRSNPPRKAGDNGSGSQKVQAVEPRTIPGLPTQPDAPLSVDNEEFDGEDHP